MAQVPAVSNAKLNPNLQKPSRKVCVLGSTGHNGVTCVQWSEVYKFNLVDFDIIIVSVRNLPPGQWLEPNSQKIRDVLSRLIASKGILIVLGTRKQFLPAASSMRGTNYSWCPIEVNTRDESGDTIRSKENMFPKFLSHLKRWNFYYEIRKDGVNYELNTACNADNNFPLRLVTQNILENRYGRTLAGATIIQKYSRHAPDTSPVDFGVIFFLPDVSDLEGKQAVNLVLEDISIPQGTVPPAWVDNVSVPGAAGIQTKIIAKRGEIQTLELDITDLEKQKHSLNDYKKLIYGDGKELEEIFARCLEQLGAKVAPAKYSQEEFILEYKDELHLVECKGVAKSIALTHLRQLLDYLITFENDEQKDGKGILLGNAWKNLPIEERGTESSIIFPQNVIDRAKMNRIALVHSADFFRAFCSFLEGKRSADSILDPMTNSAGVVDFSN